MGENLDLKHLLLGVFLFIASYNTIIYFNHKKSNGAFIRWYLLEEV